MNEHVQREMDCLHAALGDERENPKYREFYAARQALAWALDPEAFAPPLAFVMDTEEDSAGCLVRSHPPLSSDISDHCA